MFLFLTVVQGIVAAALVGVILMQKSEGGGLGVGGSPSGMMSARGAADLLTRTTTVLAVLFVSLSVALAVLAAAEGKPSELDTSLQRGAAPVEQTAPNDAVPLTGADPMNAVTAPADGGEAPATGEDTGDIPLAQ